MLTSLISIVCLSQGQLALKVGVVRLPDLVAEMATKSGEPLTSSIDLKNEVVYVNLKPKGLAELMSLISQTTGTEWIKDGNRIQLTRTSKKLREDEAIDRQSDLEILAKSLAKLPSYAEGLSLDFARQQLQLREVLNARVPKDYGALLETAQPIMPSVRLLHKILKAKNPAWMLSVSYGKLATFSSNPNRVQKPLPFSTTGMVAQFLADRKVMSAAWSDMNKSGESESSGSPEAQPNTSRPLSALVTVKRNTSGFIDVSVHVLDSDNAIVGFARANVANLPMERAKNPLAEAVKGGIQYPLHPLLTSFNKAHLKIKEDEAAIQILRDPVANEPLKVIAEGPLNSFFKDCQKEAFLALPDRFVSHFLYRSENQVSGGALLSFIDETLSTEMQGDCLVGRSNRPYLAWQARADRWAMRDILQSTPFGTPITLNALASYAAKQSELASLEVIESRWLGFGIFGSGMPENLANLEVSYGRRDGLKVWNFLSNQQRNTIQTGSQLPVGVLSNKARSALASMVFEREAFIDPTGGININLPLTLLLPTGIPDNAYFECQPKVKPYVQVQTKEGILDFMEPGSAAYVFFQQQRGLFLEPGSGYLPMEGALLKPLELILLNTKLRLTSQLTTDIFWFDYRFDPLVQTAPGEKLKGPAGEEYRRVLEHYRRVLGGG